MEQEIRSYTANGYTIKVIQYNDGGKIEYHVKHNFPSVPGGEWFKEHEKAKAIAEAQFFAWWIERQEGEQT